MEVEGGDTVVVNVGDRKKVAVLTVICSNLRAHDQPCSLPSKLQPVIRDNDDDENTNEHPDDGNTSPNPRVALVVIYSLLLPSRAYQRGQLANRLSLTTECRVISFGTVPLVSSVDTLLLLTGVICTTGPVRAIFLNPLYTVDTPNRDSREQSDVLSHVRNHVNQQI